jgi:RNA polymerase sigma-70 factor, ECF subfamily
MDRELVELARRGDRAAYEALAHECASRLFPVCLRILRDLDRAEDAMQGTLVAIWQRLPGLRDADRFEAWTYRIAVNESIAEARHGGPLGRSVPLREDDGAGPTTGTDVGSRVGDQDALERAFVRLSPEHRAVIVLRFYAGMTLEEIAGVMGTPSGTAASRLHYALAALRRDLEATARPLAAEGAIA